MYEIFIVTLLGFVMGLLQGVVGFTPMTIIIFILYYFKIMTDYKTILGTTLYVALLPLTIGSVWEFYKVKKIHFLFGNILLITLIIGSYIGSLLILNPAYRITDKMIQYMTSALGFVTFVIYFTLAYTTK
jgi:uncharacterized membrane protein YfcA